MIYLIKIILDFFWIFPGLFHVLIIYEAYSSILCGLKHKIIVIKGCILIKILN